MTERALHRAVTLTIFGEPASKANSRELVTNPKTGRPMFIKSKKALGYLADLTKQVLVRKPLLTGSLKFTATIFYATKRPDLDESLILDGLEERIYENDRQIREKHVYHAIDKRNPRAEIVIEPLEPELALQTRAKTARAGT
jgi:Holliday junction resolvase RusA-like endonuclease